MSRLDEILAILRTYSVRLIFRARLEGRGTRYAVFANGEQTSTEGTHAEAIEARDKLAAQAILELFE